MSTDTALESKAVSTIRTALGIEGVLAVIAGVLILVWPGQTAAVVTGILAFYAIAAGIVLAGLGVFSGTKGGWSRIGFIVLGILLIIAGVIAFGNLTATKLLLATFVAVFIGVTWIIEGVVSFALIGGSASKIWTALFAVISIVAGVYLLASPLWGGIVLWWLLGILMILSGVMNILRAITLRKAV